MLRGVFAGWLIARMVWLLPFAETGRIWGIIILTYVVGLGQYSHVVAGSTDVLTCGGNGECASGLCHRSLCCSTTPLDNGATCTNPAECKILNCGGGKCVKGVATTGDCLYSEECPALCSGGGCAVPGTGDGGGPTREASTARDASGPHPDAAACTHHCDDTGGGKCACKMFCGSDMYAADCDPATKACLCNPGNQAADCGTAELCSGASAFDNVGACCKFPGF